MKKIKEFCSSHREILLYLVFGVLTTIVGWGVYFGSLAVWREAFSLPVEDTSSKLYLVGYTVSQAVQWAAAVLFAFFTNRKWVFTDADRAVSLPLQLGKFACGRIATFFIDYLVTLFLSLGIAALVPTLTKLSFWDREWNFAEIGAKLTAAVIVIVCNYIFSKIFVFKKKKT